MKQLTQQHSSRKLNSDYRLFFYLSVCFSQSNILQEKVSRVCEEFLPCEDSFILYSILWRSRVCPASLPRKWSKDWDTGGGPMHLLLSPEIQICIYFNQRGGRKRKLSQTFFFFSDKKGHIFIKSMFILRTKHGQVTFCLQRAFPSQRASWFVNTLKLFLEHSRCLSP